MREQQAAWTRRYARDGRSVLVRADLRVHDGAGARLELVIVRPDGSHPVVRHQAPVEIESHGRRIDWVRVGVGEQCATAAKPLVAGRAWAEKVMAAEAASVLDT